ncbi:MAG: HXXEE domain-containing protein [Chloroflexi bacterium]|nr:HXXEE domain-containing protein [Chloroflexota bacterium]
MNTDSWMWLLPVVFMIHDFEEILMIKVWVGKNRENLNRRFPGLARRLLPNFDRLSTAGLAVIAGEEFVLLAVLTGWCVERQGYALWAGLTLGFLLHLGMHIVQWLVYGGYVPVILTSLPAAVYCLWALAVLSARGLFTWGSAAVWGGIGLAVIVANYLLATWLAHRYEALVQAYAGGPAE